MKVIPQMCLHTKFDIYVFIATLVENQVIIRYINFVVFTCFRNSVTFWHMF
jgi:hypothetical protein